jgi:glyoxylase-like metal-dependent hydrolase (beta-lactamase superfamily II)
MPERPRIAVPFLALALAVSSAAGPGPFAAAASAAGTTPEAALAELAPGVPLLRGVFVPNAQPDGNSVVLDGAGGLVVVDTGRHAAHTQRLLDHAAAAKQPIVAVVNTHWHLDHVGGNALVRRAHADAKVYASDAIAGALAEGGFLANYRVQLAGMIADSGRSEAAKGPQRAELALLDAAPALRPDVVVAESGRRTLAGRELDVHLEQRAVTGGDLWLVDRSSAILVAGDLVTLPAPFFDTACPRRWSEALGRVAAAEWRTLVPGHGPPMHRAAFARYRAAFDALLTCTASERPGTECVDGWLRDASDLVTKGDEGLARELVAYYVGNHLRDAKKTERLCSG